MLNEFAIMIAGIAAVNVLGWLSPGPNMLAIISASVTKGRRAGIATALGLSLGGFFWAVLIVMGASTVFMMFPQAVFVLRMIGAAYLLWLGIKSMRAAVANTARPMAIHDVNHSDWIAFRTGLIVMATNPKAAIFFVSVFAAFVPENAPLWVLIAIVVFSPIQAFVQHCITALVFSSKPVMLWFQTANRSISATIGAIYCGLGVTVALDAIRRV